MKRDLEPTIENIIKTLKEDTIIRNENIIETMNLIKEDFNDGGVLFIDGKWGSGKTFFVKQIQYLLDLLSSESRIEEKTNLNQLISKVENEKVVTVYFNAWENDYHSDPLLAVAYKMLSESSDIVSKKEVVKDTESIFTSLSKIIKLVSGGKYDLSELKIERDDTFKLLEVEQQIRILFMKIVDLILVERANKLVIIIDELDRCRPDFAVKLLERLKHVLVNDKIITIVSVNLEELGATIKKHYGESYKPNNYFNKFYDDKITLSKFDRFSYMVDNQEFEIDFYKYGNLQTGISSTLDYFEFSLREINEYSRILKKVDMKLRGNMFGFTSENANNFVKCIIVPFMIGLKVHNETEYKMLINGENSDELIKFIQRGELINDICAWILNFKQGQDQNEETFDSKKDIGEIYNNIFVIKGRTGRSLKVLNSEFDERIKEYTYAFIKLIN